MQDSIKLRTEVIKRITVSARWAWGNPRPGVFNLAHGLY